MSSIKNVLIVANSGRMLAQFSKNAGLTPLVIDCFADSDTQEIAFDHIKVKTLTLELVKKAFSVLKSRYAMTHVIYGSGLERYINTLEFLHQNLIVLGNRPDVFLSVHNKANFFSRLDHLQIPYPETRFQAPDINKNWLIKPMQGEGGIGIKKYQIAQENSGSYYWQKQCNGTAMSVLFIANGIDYKIIGFNKQLIVQIGENDFVFSGVISQPEMNSKVIQTVSLWLASLVTEFSFIGMNSLDFIANSERCYALEVNARPSASMQLYHDNSLLEHIDNCIESDDFQHSSRECEVEVGKSYQAYEIIFAKTDVCISENIEWPVWVADIPQTGSIIHTGLPICSIIADGKNEQQVKNKMLLRQRIINKLLR